VACREWSKASEEKLKRLQEDSCVNERSTIKKKFESIYNWKNWQNL